MEGEKEVRWGVLGTANIALKFVAAVKKLNDPKVRVAAVASRTLSKAQEWAKEQGIEKAYGSYEELLEDKDVDAVYIPLPTALHTKYAVLTAQKGKHVLCEKPLAVTVEEVEQILAACRDNKVQFMDGVMWTHHFRTREMKKQFPTIGEVRRVNSSFSVNGVPESNIRFDKATEPLGALGDLGWYNVRACLFGFGDDALPLKVWATSTFNHGGDKEKGVPMDVTAVLWYSDGKMANFDCSFNSVAWRQQIDVIGTEGTISFDGFVVPWNASPGLFAHNPTYDEKTTFTIKHDIGQIAKHGNKLETVVEVEACLHEVELVRTFNSIIRSGKLEERWPTLALNNQKIVSALYKSILTGQVVELAAQ